MSSMIESVLHETRVFPPSAEFVRQANISGMEAYRKLVAESERDFEGFWARLAREQLLWHKPFTKVLDESNAPFYRWFYDGELNASHNCLDRHLKTQPDKVAIIFEADDGKVTKITYKQLYHEVCRLANALRHHGIQSGEFCKQFGIDCRARRCLPSQPVVEQLRVGGAHRRCGIENALLEWKRRAQVRQPFEHPGLGRRAVLRDSERHIGIGGRLLK